MRSLSFTFVLAALAAMVCGVIVWQTREGNLNAILGVPPVPLGNRLYSDFLASDVGRISVSAHGQDTDFVKTEDGWKFAAAPQDRVDPRSALAIIAFTLNLNVQDSSPSEKLDLDEVGLRADSIQIRLDTASGKQLARYKMGDRTPLQRENKEAETPDPTVFIQPRERGRKDHIYACTGDIAPLFKDGFKYLRDHQPFSFNPYALQKIRLRSAQGELTLSHDNPKTEWKIVKPLELLVDPDARRTLIEGLAGLKAIKVSDRAAVTLPVGDNSGKTLQIGLTHFNSDKETLLEVYPPETPDAREVLATVSDRPATVFSLPIKPEPGFSLLSNLPVSINELRDRALTHVAIAKLRTISVVPSTGQRIQLTLDPPKKWQVTIDGKTQPANEERLFSLLKALTTSKVIGFENDAATDFTPWGLNRPVLSISLMGENDEGITLNFGIDGRGGVFVNRQGTPNVMRVEPALLTAVSIQPFEWRPSLLWSVSTTDLVGLGRAVKSQPPLNMLYDFANESWIADVQGKDVTAQIDPAKANRLLESLVGLNVSRWLAPEDADAAAALQTPLLTLNVTENTVDEFGEKNGVKHRTLTIAANPADPRIFFGRLSSELNPFVFDRDTFLKIAIDPFEK